MNGPASPDNPDGSWQFNPGDTIAPGTSSAPAPQPQANPATQPEPEVLAPRAVAVPPQGPEGSITWTASEFVAHHKSPGWYLILSVGAVVAALLVWLLTRDYISATVVVVAAIFFGAYGARQPRQLQYNLDDSGLTIGPRHFVYEQFRSFSIVPEGAFASIVFMPLKRFAPLTTIYYDPADEGKIVDLLADRLPHEERERDIIDRLMWRIRF